MRKTTAWFLCDETEVAADRRSPQVIKSLSAVWQQIVCYYGTVHADTGRSKRTPEEDVDVAAASVSQKPLPKAKSLFTRALESPTGGHYGCMKV